MKIEVKEQHTKAGIGKYRIAKVDFYKGGTHYYVEEKVEGEISRKLVITEWGNEKSHYLGTTDYNEWHSLHRYEPVYHKTIKSAVKEIKDIKEPKQDNQYYDENGNPLF